MSGEVRAGYKQTEIGLIPEDWSAERVDRICFLINGRGFKPYEWKTSGLPIIRIQNLNGSDEFNFYKGSYDPKILVKNGQLLFAWSGSRGTSFGPHIWNGSLALLNYHTWKVVANELRVTQEYLFYALRHLTNYIEDRAHGASALVHTQKWEMETFLVPLPQDISEQRAIAAALSDVDALIYSQESLIAKKRDIKQAVMQQLLTGKQRLPGFGGEWEVKRLGDFGSTYGGLTGKVKADFGTGLAHYIPFLNIMNNIVIKTDYFESVKVAATESQNEVRKGDIFFNGSSETPEELGMCAVLLEEVQNTYLNSFCFGFRFREGAQANGRYLAYFFRSDPGRELLYSMAQGATRYNLSKVNLLRLELRIPDLEEQTAIAKVLSDIDAEITALETERDKTKLLKQGMMQELLTGRIRLV